MYKLIRDTETNEINTVRLGNAFIPFDPANRDYAEYLEWLAEGNEPLPADTPE